jgi:hypothetical protein
VFRSPGINEIPGTTPGVPAPALVKLRAVHRRLGGACVVTRKLYGFELDAPL